MNVNVTTTVDVSPEDCLKALEQELCPGRYRSRPWPRADLVEKLQELHTKVMKKWIAPADRCRECDGTRECAGGSHSWTCTVCGGSGRKRGSKSGRKRGSGS